MKVLTVVGTRPEIIRLSRTISALDEGFEHVLVHTGQNYDYSLSGVFFEQLRIPKPDYYLRVGTDTLGTVLGDTLIKTERILQIEKPDAMLILGDTNSSISAIIGKRYHVPVYHMEAGNRSFDANVPEEINRRIVDHVADFNLVYTEHARRNLLAEGIHPRRIHLSGSPMAEVLNHYCEDFKKSQVLTTLGVSPSRYFVVSAHREENVDNPKRLMRLVETLEAVAQHFDLPVLVSTHPRTKLRLSALGVTPSSGVHFHEPLGFFDYVRLQQEAFCVLSDSGTISEESSILDFPAVTFRESIERPEALDTGGIVMSPIDPDAAIIAIKTATTDYAEPLIPAEYAIGDTSIRVTRFMLSTFNFSARWDGIYDAFCEQSE